MVATTTTPATTTANEKVKIPSSLKVIVDNNDNIINIEKTKHIADVIIAMSTGHEDNVLITYNRLLNHFVKKENKSVKYFTLSSLILAVAYINATLDIVYDINIVHKNDETFFNVTSNGTLKKKVKLVKISQKDIFTKKLEAVKRSLKHLEEDEQLLLANGYDFSKLTKRKGGKRK